MYHCKHTLFICEVFWWFKIRSKTVTVDKSGNHYSEQSNTLKTQRQ